MIGIYKITNPKGKVYIGQSVEIEKRRWKYMSCNCPNQTKVYRSLKKYGWDNHTFEVIKECEMVDLNYWEILFIKQYNCVEDGLNLRLNGTKPNNTNLVYA